VPTASVRPSKPQTFASKVRCASGVVPTVKLVGSQRGLRKNQPADPSAAAPVPLQHEGSPAQPLHVGCSCRHVR
jgi:hypothetical protein